MSHLIYLHGFLSSPASVKAQQCLAYFTQYAPHIRCHLPTLSGYPKQAVDTIEKVIEEVLQDTNSNDLRFVGSSMGGYLSTYFVEKYGGKAVLINPAVTPYDLLSEYQGEHVNPNTQEHFAVTKTTIDELRSLDTVRLNRAAHYKVLLQTNDETLDYRLAKAKYHGSDVVIEQGGNHSFEGFENHLPSIYEFLFASS